MNCFLCCAFLTLSLIKLTGVLAVICHLSWFYLLVLRMDLVQVKGTQALKQKYLEENTRFVKPR